MPIPPIIVPTVTGWSVEPQENYTPPTIDATAHMKITRPSTDIAIRGVRRSEL